MWSRSVRSELGHKIIERKSGVVRKSGAVRNNNDLAARHAKNSAEVRKEAIADYFTPTKQPGKHEPAPLHSWFISASKVAAIQSYSCAQVRAATTTVQLQVTTDSTGLLSCVGKTPEKQTSLHHSSPTCSTLSLWRKSPVLSGHSKLKWRAPVSVHNNTRFVNSSMFTVSLLSPKVLD